MTDDSERQEKLFETVAAANRILRTHRTLPAKLEAVCAILQRTIRGCDAVSIGLIVEGRPGTAACSGDLAIEADLAQYSTGEGPCLDSVAGGRTVRVELLDEGETYRHFAPLAIELGVESVVSVPLVHQGTTVGSANIYSAQTGAFEDIDLSEMGSTFDYAAEAIATSPLYAYSLGLLDVLVETVQERNAVATAVGILMETNRCSEATAMTLLQRASDVEDRSLFDVSCLVIDSTLLGSGVEEHQI